MRIAVVGIGDELLAGFTVNSNAAFISHALFELGLQVSSQRVLPDGDVTGLAEAIHSFDLVICTGGLGPTLDDRTRVIVADLVQSELRYNEEVAEKLRDRLGDVPTLTDQATIPAGATPFHNQVGTAPGLLFELEQCTLVMLPGVPVEMEAMVEGQLIPYLREQYPSGQRPYLESLHFFQLPEAVIDTKLRELEEPDLQIGIYPRLGVVNVRLSSYDKEKLAPAREALISAFRGHFFEGETLEGALHELCVARGLTLSTAESCTGGAVAAALTARPGASHYFLGSVVAYSDAIKENVLGVSTLSEYGAVSRETVVEMVTGLLELTKSALGVAISGIAGPTGGTPDKPVGTVWIAVAKRGEQPITSSFIGRGNRAAIIQRSINWSLAELYKLILFA